MARKSDDEKLENVQKKIEQMKALEKALKKRKSDSERKARTRRLIELGGIVESVLGRKTTDEDKIRFQNFLYMQEANGKFFSKAMNVTIVNTEKSE